MALLRVAGFDPSLRNWGIACGLYDTDTKSLVIKHLSTIQPVLPTSKQVRQNSKDLESAVQHATGALEVLRQAQATFVEIPVGSQSARAMAGYALCVGVLGTLRALGHSFYELTPTEVKVIATGKATATKREMIDWAMAQHPEADWPMQTKRGKTSVVESKAEHMADAVATIHAGLASNSFQQSLSVSQLLGTT